MATGFGLNTLRKQKDLSWHVLGRKRMPDEFDTGVAAGSLAMKPHHPSARSG
jgi:hypothetical protein